MLGLIHRISASCRTWYFRASAPSIACGVAGGLRREGPGFRSQRTTIYYLQTMRSERSVLVRCSSSFVFFSRVAPLPHLNPHRCRLVLFVCFPIVFPRGLGFHSMAWAWLGVAWRDIRSSRGVLPTTVQSGYGFAVHCMACMVLKPVIVFFFFLPLMACTRWTDHQFQLGIF